MNAGSVQRRFATIREEFPDTEVHDYEPLVSGMGNDPVDRHVLAAAVRGGAQVVVTFNLRHFPCDALDPDDICAVHPDAFLLDQLDLYPNQVLGVLQEQAADCRREPNTVEQLPHRLEASQLAGFAQTVRNMLESDGGQGLT